MRKQLFLFLLIVLAMVSAVACIRNALTPYASQDLQWQPVTRILQRQNPYTSILNGEKDTFLFQAPNYPVSGYTFLLPLGLFEWETARAIWIVCNLIFTALIIVGLQTAFPLRRERWFLLACLFLSSTPWRTTISNGQHGLFVLAFFVWAIVYMEKRPTRSALFLAISLFKYSITAPLAIYFVWKRQWRLLLTTILIHIVLTGSMALWLRENPITLLRQPFQVATIATITGDYDIFSLSQRAEINTAIPAVIALTTLVAITIIPIIRAHTTPPLRALSILALTAYIIFFHRNYDLVLLIFPAWFALHMLPIHSKSESKSRESLLVIIFVLLAWYGRRIVLILFQFMPTETLRQLLYNTYLILLALTHLTVLMTLVLKGKKSR